MVKKVAVVDPTLCDQAPACILVVVCPFGAIEQEPAEYDFPGFGKPVTVNQDLCTGCGKCLPFCSTGAISLVEKE